MDETAVPQQTEEATPTEPTTTTTQPTEEEVKAPFPVLVGIDLGNEDIVLAACNEESGYPTIVRNDTSDTTTKNLLTVKGVERLYGESAVGHVRDFNAEKFYLALNPYLRFLDPSQSTKLC